MELIGGFGYAVFTAVALLVIALLIALAVMALWGAWLDRSIAAWEALLLLAAILWLAWSAAVGVKGQPWRTVLSLLTLFAAWGLGVQLRRRTDRAIIRGLIEEDMERAFDLLARNEDDPIAHSVLGDCYRKQGRLHDAIAEYETALGIVPNMPEVKASLAAVRRERAEREENKERCRECGKMIYRGAPMCPECGVERRRPGAIGEMVQGGSLFLIFKWLTITGLVVVTLVAIAQYWPDATFYTITLACIAVLVGIAYDIFRGAA